MPYENTGFGENRVWCSRLLSALFVAVLLVWAADGQKTEAPAAAAILSQKCFQCHGAMVQMSNLGLNTRAAMLKGGTQGPAIIPGNAEASLLYRRITGQDKPVMPLAPLASLKPEEIAAIKDWINQGAPWADDSAAPARVPPTVKPDSGLLNYGNYHERPVTDADREWWSFKQPVRPQVPSVKDSRWSRNPIDAFVKSALDQARFSPAPVADRNTLIRRAYLDLLGLLPSPAEVDAFVKDGSPDAYARLIDRLLESPHYGERWGRLWLDVARYGDTTGYEFDLDKPEAWRYRDYVIKALNEDKPYNRFILEQLAGDELDHPTYDSVAATGFLRLGPRVADREDENPEYRFDYLDDMIRTTYQGLQGLSVNCARCHDHKFDPITRKDYYKTLAIFNSAVEYDHPLAPWAEAENYEKIRKEINAKIKPLRKQIAEIEAPYRREQAKRRLTTLPADVQEAINTPEVKRTAGQKLLAAQFPQGPVVSDDDPDEIPMLGLPIRGTVARPGPLIKVGVEDEKSRKKLLDQIAELRAQLPPMPQLAFGMRDGDFRFIPHRPFQPGTSGIVYENFGFRGKYVPEPGDHYEPPPAYFASNGLTPFREEIKAPVIRPGFLTVLTKGNPPVADPPKDGRPTSGRRRALAEFITSEENPLTARVMVNRIWYQHFGQGIVATPNNFGKMGARPTHPELLDWLATEFMRQRWSIKQMHRLIMNSETYRMASTYYQAVAAERDSTDKLLWRFPVKRLEAEILRDIILSASGRLNPQAGGKPFFPPISQAVLDTARNRGIWTVTKEEPSTWRRSVYAYVKRNMKYPMFDVFDEPDTNITCERRDVTTVPTQALTLLNNEFVLLHAKGFAERVAREGGNDATAQVTLAYRIAFSRDPSARELDQSVRFLTQQENAAGAPSEAARLAALGDLAHVIFNANEFVYIN